MLFEKYTKISEEKNSVININLDPALPKQRKEFIINEKYLKEDDGETLLNFSLDIIEQVSDVCCAIKPNTQYFLSETKILRDIVKKIHSEGLLAILDHKLNDIGSTTESAIYWISDMSFDALTFSPFTGNVKMATDAAHKKNLGIIVWTLPSNAEAKDIVLNAKVDGIPLYEFIAKKVKESEADGCVVGLTGHAKEEHIKNIQNIVGDSTIFLMQGVGPQGANDSDIQKIKLAENPLIGLGRGVIFSEDVRGSVKRYNDLFNKIRGK